MSPIIHIENLHFTYPDGTVALRGVTLDIEEGESIGLVGKNGSGKSTLIKHLNGLYFPEKGQIVIDGLPLTEENITAIRAKLGIVFQDPDNQLFCPTVYDDVAFGPLNMDMEEKVIAQKVRQALKKMDLFDLADRSPHELSFGQRKRAAIATILSLHPKVMIFDEPTSNLDPKNEAVIADILAHLLCTRIIISHDLPILYQTCPKIVIMKEGIIDKILSIEEFLSDRQLLREHGLDFTFKCDCCHEHKQYV